MTAVALACPECGDRASDVSESRPKNENVFARTRTCKRCGHSYRTFECRADLLRNGITPAEIDDAINALASLRVLAKAVRE